MPGSIIMLPTPPAGAAPLSSAQLDQIVAEAETYLCEIFRRKCRVPFIVKKEFVSRGFAWAVLNQKLLMFTSSKPGGRLTTKILNHCSIFDEIYEPAIRRFYGFLSEAGHVNHSLFIYDGELLPNHEVLELAKESPDSVVIRLISISQKKISPLKSAFLRAGASPPDPLLTMDYQTSFVTFSFGETRGRHALSLSYRSVPWNFKEFCGNLF